MNTVSEQTFELLNLLNRLLEYQDGMQITTFSATGCGAMLTNFIGHSPEVDHLIAKIVVQITMFED